MSKKKVLLRGVFINRDTNGEGVLKVGTTLIRVSTVMGILYGQMESSLKIFVRLQIFRVRNYIQETILKTECAMAFLEPESIHMMQ